MQGTAAVQWGVQPMPMASWLQQQSGKAVDQQLGGMLYEQAVEEVETLNVAQGCVDPDMCMWLQEAASCTEPFDVHRTTHTAATATAQRELEDSSVQLWHLLGPCHSVPALRCTPPPPQTAAAAAAAVIHLQHPIAAPHHSPQAVLSSTCFARTPEQHHQALLHSIGSSTSAQQLSDRTVEQRSSSYWSAAAAPTAADLQPSVQQHSPQPRLSSSCCANAPEQRYAALSNMTGTAGGAVHEQANHTCSSHPTRRYTSPLPPRPTAAASVVLAAAALPQTHQLKTALLAPTPTIADTVAAAAAAATTAEFPGELYKQDLTPPGNSNDPLVIELTPSTAAAVAACQQKQLPSGIPCKHRCVPLSSSSEIVAAEPAATQAAAADACRTGCAAVLSKEESHQPGSSSAIWGVPTNDLLLEIPAEITLPAASEPNDVNGVHSASVGTKLRSSSSSAGAPGLGNGSESSSAKRSTAAAAARAGSPVLQLFSNVSAELQPDAMAPPRAAGAAVNAKRKQANMLCQRRIRQRHWEELQELKSQVVNLSARNTLLQSKLDRQQTNFAQVLKRLATVTDKWRLTVATNAELHRENAETRQTISQLQQLLGQNSAPPQQWPYLHQQQMNEQQQHWNEQQEQEQCAGRWHGHSSEQYPQC